MCRVRTVEPRRGSRSCELRYISRVPLKLARLGRRLRRISLMLLSRDAAPLVSLLLSITAGLCEAVLYRGYLPFFLGRPMPLAVDALLARAFFGLPLVFPGERIAVRS